MEPRIVMFLNPLPRLAGPLVPVRDNPSSRAVAARLVVVHRINAREVEETFQRVLAGVLPLTREVERASVASGMVIRGCLLSACVVSKLRGQTLLL